MKLSETKSISKFSLLQIGKSGSGKTWRSIKATRFGRVKFIDLDNKLVALREKIPVEIQEKIDVEFPKTYDELVKIIDAAVASKQFATIVLDTWTRAHDLTIEKHKALNPKSATLTLQDWGNIKKLNKELLGRLLASPTNVIVNAHIGSSSDEFGRNVLTVGTTGSFGSEMPTFFNETHTLIVQGGKNKIRGRASDLIESNTSLPDKYLDKDGMFIADDLSIFDEIAFKL